MKLTSCLSSPRRPIAQADGATASCNVSVLGHDEQLVAKAPQPPSTVPYFIEAGGSSMVDYMLHEEEPVEETSKTFYQVN